MLPAQIRIALLDRQGPVEVVDAELYSIYVKAATTCSITVQKLAGEGQRYYDALGNPDTVPLGCVLVLIHTPSDGLTRFREEVQRQQTEATGE